MKLKIKLLYFQVVCLVPHWLSGVVSLPIPSPWLLAQPLLSAETCLGSPVLLILGPASGPGRGALAEPCTSSLEVGGHFWSPGWAGAAFQTHDHSGLLPRLHAPGGERPSSPALTQHHKEVQPGGPPPWRAVSRTVWTCPHHPFHHSTAMSSGVGWPA